MRPDAAEALLWYLIAARSGDVQAEAEAARIAPAVPAVRRAEIERQAAQFTAAA